MSPVLGIFMGAVGGLMVFVLALFVISRFATPKAGLGWLNPAWVVLAGILGLVAGAVALWLLNRYSGRSVGARA
jgi:hypothetical protein